MIKNRIDTLHTTTQKIFGNQSEKIISDIKVKKKC